MQFGENDRVSFFCSILASIPPLPAGVQVQDRCCGTRGESLPASCSVGVALSGGGGGGPPHPSHEPWMGGGGGTEFRSRSELA